MLTTVSVRKFLWMIRDQETMISGFVHWSLPFNHFSLKSALVFSQVSIMFSSLYFLVSCSSVLFQRLSLPKSTSSTSSRPKESVPPKNPTGSCRWLDPCASEQSFRPLGWWKWASKACWKNGWTKSVDHPHLGCMKPPAGAGFWSLRFEDKKQLNYLVNRLNRAVRVYPRSKYTPYKPRYVD